MRINIVTTDERWVLRNIAENYAKYLPNCTISYFEPDPDAEVNFYICYGLWKGKTSTKDVVYFTHRELQNKGLQDLFDKASRECDFGVSMCEITTEFLDKSKTITSHPGVDQLFHRGNIVLGVAGREYVTGRKRFEWIEKLKQIEGIEIKFANGNYSLDQMPEFYKSIDYLLVLSDNEGGPLPLYEALSMGVPVISSRVGGAPHYTVHLYDSYEELEGLIKGLVVRPDKYKIEAERLLEKLKEL
jgi:glycosyltransferase involved in cell wall biosynthesis